MKLWEHRNRYLPAAGFLPAAVLAACVAGSLHGYTAPVFSMETTEEEQDASEQTTEPDASKKKNTSATAPAKKEVPSVTPVSEKSAYQDGTYTGTGTGFAGPITVQVIIKGGKIAEITVLSTSDDSPYIDNAKALLKNIVAVQSTNVDTVSGATYSSVGLISAVRDALQKAGGSSASDSALPTLAASPAQSHSSGEAPTVETVEEPAAYADGVYTGSGTGFGGPLTVQVTVSGGKITDIIVLSTSDDSPYIDNAKVLLNNIITLQSTNVDAVSGATYSSAGLIEAVRNALQGAATGGGTAVSAPVTTAPAKTTAPAEIPQGKFPYPDGVYKGSGEGYRGETHLQLTLKNGTITKIEVLDTEDDAAFFKRAEALIATVIGQQSTEVDAVSGATFSSEGILETIDDALNAAKKAGEPAVTTTVTTETTACTGTSDTASSTETTTEPVPQIYEDGVYVGTADCDPDESEDFATYEVSLKVKIEHDTMIEITDVKGDSTDYDPENDRYLSRAAKGTSKIKGTIAQILEQQGTEDIDAVSGATCSSDAIRRAVEQALEQARKGV